VVQRKSGSGKMTRKHSLNSGGGWVLKETGKYREDKRKTKGAVATSNTWFLPGEAQKVFMT